MDFDYIIKIIENEIDLSTTTINEFRECIKNIAITEEQNTKIEGIIPKPWYLGKCPDDGKPAIYNEIAEIIDNYVGGFIPGLKPENTSCLRNYKEISSRLIEKRLNEISKSISDIKKEQYIYLPVIGTTNQRLNQIINIVGLK
ncbi:hypothetical protein DVW08_12630 [Clostridium botulinum]|nr:hypothetical protein [Clostridium botulinum]